MYGVQIFRKDQVSTFSNFQQGKGLLGHCQNVTCVRKDTMKKESCSFKIPTTQATTIKRERRRLLTKGQRVQNLTEGDQREKTSYNP